MSGKEYETHNPNGERTLLEILLHYLFVLQRYRKLLLITTAVVAACAAVFCIVTARLPANKSPFPDKYTASAVVLVLRGMGDNLSATILSALGIESLTAEPTIGFDTGELVLLVLRSRTILDKVVEEFDFAGRYGVTDQSKSRLRALVLAKSHFDYSRTTSAITISFTDIDPIFAKDVTNGMVALINEWFAQNMSSTNLKQKQLLDEKVKEVRADIDKLENQLKNLQTKYGALTAQDLGTSQASTLAALRSQLILKEIDIKNYSAVSAIEDPKLQQLKNERKNILDLISQTQRGVPDVQGSTDGQKNLPDLQIEFNNLTVELDIQRKIYDTLSHQREVLKLTSESESAFQIVDLAEVPDRKSEPRRARIVALATLAAFAIGAAASFFLNGLAQLKRDLEKRLLKNKSAERVFVKPDLRDDSAGGHSLDRR